MQRFIGTGALLGAVLLLSGCSLPTRNATVTIADLSGGVTKSTDRGQTYNPAVKVSDRQTIASVETLSLAVDPADTQKIYLGSLSDGVWVTKDGAQTWEKLSVPITKNYAIAVHPTDTAIAYITGVYDGRGKIAKTTDGGATWKEVYTEPADGTVVLSLALDKRDPNTLYAGTDAGMVIVSHDGGSTWENKFSAKNAIRALATDTFEKNTVYAMTFQDSLLVSRDGGATFTNTIGGFSDRVNARLQACFSDSKKCADDAKPQPGAVYSFVLDARTPGMGYVGTDKGLFRFTGYGSDFQKLNIIGSSEAFPITAVAVGLESSKELYYNSAQAIYRTLDGGTTWFPFQLDSDKVSVSVMAHDLKDPGVLYVGLRKSQK